MFNARRFCRYFASRALRVKSFGGHAARVERHRGFGIESSLRLEGQWILTNSD
jgi:hypothetical protein